MTQSSDKPEDKKETAAADTAKQGNLPKPEQKNAKAKASTGSSTKASPASSTEETAVEPPVEAAVDSPAAESEQTATDSTSAASKPESSRANSNAAATGIAVLALILSLGGFGAGVWSVMQSQAAGDLNAQQQQQLAAMQSQAADFTQREQQLNQQLEQLPTAQRLQQDRELLVRMQAEQQQLSQRLETVLGASRQDWRLAEAEHLLRMASLRLTALHDITSARFLLEAADQILMEQDDPAAFAAREQLAHSIAALRNNRGLDRTGLFVQLGALHQLAGQLTHLAPEFIQGQQAASELGRWAQWWEHISRYVRIDFNADQQIQPLLAGQSLSQVRLAIGLALEQAQWAALNGATEVYQQALQQALDILDSSFDNKDPNVAGLKEQIGELSKQKVQQQLPDLNAALITLQAYIESRSTPQDATAEESN